MLLSRIRLLQQYGQFLEYIDIDMDLVLPSQKKRALRTNNGVTLSSILRQCPRLIGISICNTALNIIDTNLQFRQSIGISDQAFHFLYLILINFQ